MQNKMHANYCISNTYTSLDQNNEFNPLTAGVVHIRFLYFLLAHYISAFKPVKDKKLH